MKNDPNQLEMLDLRRGDARPAGGGQVIGGFFVYHAPAQRVDQVAYTCNCTEVHLYKQIQLGVFPNATNIGSPGSSRPCYRIPRQDVLDWIEGGKTGIRD